MAGALVLLLCVSARLLTGCYGFQWQENLPDGEQIVKCSGENVTFPWRFTVENQDDLIGISWILQHGKEEKVLGNFAFDIFKGEIDRLTQVGKAGIKLTKVTPQDTGTYIVYTRLNGDSDVRTRKAHLVVVEQPRTKNGRLELMVNDVLSGETTPTQPSATNGDDRLLCGEFTDIGSPPVSVIWEDPDGHILPSTGYEQGYFILNLSEHSKGGNYHCQLSPSSTALACLPPDSALRDKSFVGVLKRPSASATDTTKQTSVDNTKQTSVDNTEQTSEAGMSGGAVAGVVIAVLIVIAIIVIALVFAILRLRRGKSYAPKEPDSPGPEEEAAQPFKV